LKQIHSTVVVKFEQASESLGRFVKSTGDCLPIHAFFNLLFGDRRLRIFIVNRLSGEDAVPIWLS
jgi:hypothetical protein